MKTQNLFSQSWSEVTSGERNEIVFERLNQSYGAFQIRRNYGTSLLKSFSGTILLAIMLSGFLFLAPKTEAPVIIPYTGPIPVDPPTDPPATPPIDRPIEPPVDPPSGPPVDEFLVPVITDDSILKKDSLPILLAQVEHTEGNTNGPGDTNSENPTGGNGGGGHSIEKPDSVYDGFIDNPPSFPGGDEALFGFLKKNIVYPEMVKEVGGKGTVGVAFILDKEGNVTEVSVLKSTRYSELNNEAVRVIKKLPKWIPGKQHGRAVKVKMVLPIRFEIR